MKQAITKHKYAAGTAFVGLNMIDAQLTKMALAKGAIELNPIVSPYGSNIAIKGLVALVIAGLLYHFKKEKLLLGLNLIFTGIVLWNLYVVVRY